VSLQGSLDGFPLPDVLTLLATTKKQGELRVAGQQGAGRVWLAEGAVVGVEAGSVRAPVDALCQLLRVDTGTFTFDPAGEVPDGKPCDLEPLLAEAQSRLAEWRTIEAVVPSLATRVQLTEELPASKVTVSAAQWRVLRTIAVTGTVEDVAAALDADEFHACQAVKRLVDAGLVLVVDGQDRKHARAKVVADTAVHGEAVEPPVDVEPADEPEPEAEKEESKSDPDDLVTIPDHLRGRSRRREEPKAEPERPRRRDPMAEAAARRRRELANAGNSELVGAAAAALTPENASDLVRELSDLGADAKTAKKAIEAASQAETTEERAAALEGVLNNEDGEPLNRTMLLKFLSSVRA